MEILPNPTNTLQQVNPGFERIGTLDSSRSAVDSGWQKTPGTPGLRIELRKSKQYIHLIIHARAVSPRTLML